MGMGPMQSLLRVELPLALPAIIAGLRIATVTVISLATVAAVVDNEGLGVPIFTAISNEVFKTELITAGAMAVGLALVADGLLVLVQRALTPWARA
jgi:osmoprotectant transport system permease protein